MELRCGCDSCEGCEDGESCEGCEDSESVGLSLTESERERQHTSSHQFIKVLQSNFPGDN